MIKFKTIQTKIKLLYLKFTGKIKISNSFIEINQSKNKSIKNILIFFAVKEDAFRVALYAFRRFKKNKNVNYYYVINSVYKHHFNLSGYVFNFHNNKDTIKIDETFYEDIIINKSFDMTIDLNNEFNYDICYLVNRIKSYYKIGFKNNYSDYFYNIQLEADVLEDSYNKIHLMLI